MIGVLLLLEIFALLAVPAELLNVGVLFALFPNPELLLVSLVALRGELLECVILNKEVDNLDNLLSPGAVALLGEFVLECGLPLPPFFPLVFVNDVFGKLDVHNAVSEPLLNLKLPDLTELLKLLIGPAALLLLVLLVLLVLLLVLLLLLNPGSL